MRPDRERIVGILVVLIALHSVGVGVVLVFFPAFAVRFGGWGNADPLFFPRQGGAFHFVLVAAYLIDWFRHRSVAILVTAKGIAFTFLLGAFLAGERAWSVPLSGVSDGAMGLVAWAAVRWAAARETARG